MRKAQRVTYSRHYCCHLFTAISRFDIKRSAHCFKLDRRNIFHYHDVVDIALFVVVKWQQCRLSQSLRNLHLWRLRNQKFHSAFPFLKINSTRVPPSSSFALFSVTACLRLLSAMFLLALIIDYVRHALYRYILPL